MIFYYKIPPAVWFFGLLAAAWGLEKGKPLPMELASFEVRLWTAVALFGGAAAFAGWGIVLFQLKKTTIVPFGTAATLVTSGPFRFSRNPLYVSLVATLAAFGVLLGSAWYVLTAALLAVALDRLVIRQEEQRLHELFGREYADYVARVRRWL